MSLATLNINHHIMKTSYGLHTTDPIFLLISDKINAANSCFSVVNRAQISPPPFSCSFRNLRRLALAAVDSFVFAGLLLLRCGISWQIAFGRP